MGKLETPDWIKEGFDSKADWEKKKGIKTGGKNKEKSKEKGKGKAGGKVYRLKKCPKCGSTDVGVELTGEEGKGTGNWICKKCKWKGEDIEEKEVSEDEFLEMMEKE